MTEPEIKIGYRMLNGHDSTAYVLEKPDHRGVHTGTNKYTDEDVAVVWNDDFEGWLEVKGGEQ